jgi:hypothetical protein
VFGGSQIPRNIKASPLRREPAPADLMNTMRYCGCYLMYSCWNEAQIHHAKIQPTSMWFWCLTCTTELHIVVSRHSKLLTASYNSEYTLNIYIIIYIYALKDLKTHNKQHLTHLVASLARRWRLTSDGNHYGLGGTAPRSWLSFWLHSHSIPAEASNPQMVSTPHHPETQLSNVYTKIAKIGSRTRVPPLATQLALTQTVCGGLLASNSRRPPAEQTSDLTPESSLNSLNWLLKSWLIWLLVTSVNSWLHLLESNLTGIAPAHSSRTWYKLCSAPRMPKTNLEADATQTVTKREALWRTSNWR